MNDRKVTMALGVMNVGLMVALFIQGSGPAAARAAEPEGPLPMLRASGLEIVDGQGRVRALLAVQPPATVDGKDYPETVLLRLVDPESGPVVKLTAARNGSALTLSDDGDGGVDLFARDNGSFARVRTPQGQEAVLKP